MSFMKRFIPILFALTFVLISCNGVLGEKKEITVNLKCGEIPLGALMVDMSTEEGIKFSCDDACLGNNMRYAGSYTCQANTNLLICSCLVTNEKRKEMGGQNDANSICKNFCNEEFTVETDERNPKILQCLCNDGRKLGIA